MSSKQTAILCRECGKGLYIHQVKSCDYYDNSYRAYVPSEWVGKYVLYCYTTVDKCSVRWIGPVFDSVGKLLEFHKVGIREILEDLVARVTIVK